MNVWSTAYFPNAWKKPKLCLFVKAVIAAKRTVWKILYKRVYRFSSKNNTFSIKQFGFRSKLSTVDAIASFNVEIRPNWYKSKNLTKCTFIDLKKSFWYSEPWATSEKVWKLRTPRNSTENAWIICERPTPIY